MGKIILIIEDDKGLNQGVALALRKPDWKFLQAFSLKEGMEYWETAEVDMVDVYKRQQFIQIIQLRMCQSLKENLR